jgi:hypothetical protein
MQEFTGSPSTSTVHAPHSGDGDAACTDARPVPPNGP